MANFVKRVEDLSSACWDIEAKLPIFHITQGPLNDAQYLRKELYQIRCAIGALKRYAEMVDNPPPEITLDDLLDTSPSEMDQGE